MRIKLYKPHAGQIPLHNSERRFRIATCGRRFGKSFACINEIVKFSWENPKKLSWWCAPSFYQSRIAYRVITEKFHKVIDAATKNPMEIKLKSGGIIQFKSTDIPDNLRGEGVSFLICDESSMMQEEAWTQALRPTLSDKNGRAILVGTPKGRNWFYGMFMRGQDPAYPDYESWSFPTSANPYIPAEEIEEVRSTLPSDVFKQEYLAEFLDNGGIVFRSVNGCVRGSLEEPHPDKEYILSWDVAKHSDFSCVIVMDRETRHVVAFDRFNRIDYSLQVERIAHIANKYNYAKVIMDSTGVGDPLLEQVKRRGLSVQGFNFTNTSKQQLVEHLAVMIEKQEISFPDIKVLIGELLSYQYELTRAGNVKYNAPSGLHDDCVVALALATWAVKHKRELNIMVI